jgi:flagellar motility protein MotE (MotC chaperone)
MNPRYLLWISAPLALSAGVLWLSAQEPKGENKAAAAEGVKVAELASQLQNREKALAQKEAELRQLEQRLTTLQATLDKDRGDLAIREKAVNDALLKVENLKVRPAIDPQIIRTYEAMDAAAGAQAMKELAGQNMEVAVALLAGMTPKKAGKLMDALAILPEGGAKLAGRLSEKVGMSKPKDPAA